MLASLTNANRARASRLAALGACAAAALVCLWLLERLAWLLVPQGDVASASAPVASTPAAVPVQSVGKWHLFGNPQTIAVLQQMRNAPATTLKLTLRGTLAMDDAHDGIAMIEDEHGGERAYKVGEVVGTNAKLVAVYADHVVLDHEGVAETLTELAERFVISHPNVSTMLVGYSTLQHLEEAIAAVNKGPLPAAAIQRIGG